MFDLLENKCILVVDDDATNREVVIDALVALAPKTKVLSAIHGKQALKILEEKQVDLILLDWEMPVLNGYQTLLKLKANEATKRIPVIMYTGIMTDVQSLQNALKAGAADFLRKPTDPIEILARIQSILTQQFHYNASLEAERGKYEAQLNEMLAVSLHLQQAETFMEKMQQSLKEAVQASNPKENLQKLIRELKHSDINEVDWERYKLRMDAAQKGFIEKLHQLHPSLTRQQLTICSLLRLGMVSKEAASILNISLEAMDKSRYRIRKKMNLSLDTVLEIYLLEI